MTTFLQYALLGLGAGGAYAIAAVGLLQVYRGSGVLNLSHGATAYAAAALFVYGFGQKEWPFPLAAAAAVALAGAIGVAVQLWVMHPLRNAPPLVRMIATLGVFAVLQQGVPLIFGRNFSDVLVPSYYPQGKFQLGSDSLLLPYDRLIVLAVTVALGVGLWALQSRTRLGLATTAVAENRVVASSFGIAPNAIAVWNWGMGVALAGLAGVLLVPIIGVVTPLPFVFLVVPAMAAAMIGGFKSFTLTILGGLVIGMGQSILIRYQATVFPPRIASGWSDAFPFMVIIAVLMLRGSPFPARSEIAARLPRLGRRTVSPLTATGVAVVGGFAVTLTSNTVAGAIAASAGLAIVGLSLVVLTGMAGQTSLAQMTMAGIGAMVAARLSHGTGLPFLVVLILGVLAGTAVGIIFAAPAMRTRGPALAVATIGIGIGIQSVVLNNGWFTLNGLAGTPIRAPHLGPLDIDGVLHPQRYAAFATVMLVAVAYAVANIRAGRSGRRLIAVRSSERAASATGISLTTAKLTAFTVSAALAALGGIIMAFRGLAVTYEQFDVLQSFNLVILTLIGGVGYVLGPVLGGAMAPNGLMASLLSDVSTLERWLVITSGFVLILTLIMNPHGIAASGDLKRGAQRRPRRPIRTTHPKKRVEGEVLSVSGLTVRYGSVVAVRDLSLEVRPGQIVGLIGPNGAGKTSALDAITGFNRSAAGTVHLGDRNLAGLAVHARAGAGLARSFQTVETFDDLTVAENLAVASNSVRWSDWIRDAVAARAIELDDDLQREATALGLDLDAMPDELSQGRRRILGVLRALAARPAVLLLDEPAAGLDSTETEQLGAILRQVATERKIGMLLVEHDMSLVAAVCDSIVAMDFGSTIVSAPTEEALSHPLVRAAYLGEADEDLMSSIIPADRARL